jgi:hypothetical protein
MTSDVEPKRLRKRTPADVTPFEREQLRFFLAQGDLVTTLADVNPSLAWLPVLWEMNLVQSETQLIAWIERNFEDIEALREVVANVRFFGPETANFLQYRLNLQMANLPSFLAKCWSLVIRYMSTAKHAVAENEWFEIAPQLRRGDHTFSMLERLANTLRPKLKIGKRFAFRDIANDGEPKQPSDLMSIDFEVDERISSDEVLAAWPNNAAPATDEVLLSQLAGALGGALADATDVGVESNEAYSTSDIDVPSVAAHRQNEYRSGFQVIVRVMADIWTRLAANSPDVALTAAERWRDSQFRLMRRLAMFAFANPAVPGRLGADMLIGLPSGELFLTGSSVEVYRLIRERWHDFPSKKRQQILRRLCEGPPRSWFREGAEVDHHIDRSRFDILSDMVRNGFAIGRKAEKLLADIRRRWPQWGPKPAEQGGFSIWHESGAREGGGDISKLKRAADGDLVTEARRIDAAASFTAGDIWQALSQSDPDRALRGLDAAATRRDWPKDYWQQLLWSRTTYQNDGTEQRIAQLLSEWPQGSFGEIAVAASVWLGEHAKTLTDELLWPLWDRIADATLTQSAEAVDE